MKYKLINKQTGEEHLCEKVVIDGWDYYVNDENIHVGDYYLTFTNKIVMGDVRKCEDSSYNFTHCKKVIATNNPSIDIFKVVDEVEILVNKLDTPENLDQFSFDKGFIDGYNKSQETHPFSEEDMIEFDKWKNEKYKLLHSEYVDTNDYYSIPDLKSVKKYTTKELLQLWKEQRTKTLYYE